MCKCPQSVNYLMQKRVVVALHVLEYIQKMCSGMVCENWQSIN